MSAAVIAPPATAVEEAHAVLHMALAAKWPAGKGRTEIFSAVVALGCALKACAGAGGEAQEARAASAADELIRAMTAHCGPGWASPPPCLRDVLADALWIAHCWYDDPGFPNPAKADLYRELHDTVVTAPDDVTALRRITAAVADGSADLGDIAVGDLERTGGAR